MELSNVSELIRSAMAYERSRVEVASHNLAMANVAIAPNESSPLLRVLPHGSFSNRLGPLMPHIEAQADTELRKVHEPSHPLADRDGMVHYPRVEAANEMATLVSATRAYEANIRAYNTLRSMNLKAFEIGK